MKNLTISTILTNYILMFIYFEKINSVLTCQEYPQIMKIEDVLLNNNEDLCNKWEKNDNEDGTFTLSFKYKRPVCDCDNSHFENLPDFHNYYCYNCRIHIRSVFEEGTNVYLQNSGHMVVVAVDKNLNLEFYNLREVDGYPNIYKWANTDIVYNTIFALHVVDNRLSDDDVSNNIDNITDYCHIKFVEDLWPTYLLK